MLNINQEMVPYSSTGECSSSYRTVLEAACPCWRKQETEVRVQSMIAEKQLEIAFYPGRTRKASHLPGMGNLQEWKKKNKQKTQNETASASFAVGWRAKKTLLLHAIRELLSCRERHCRMGWQEEASPRQTCLQISLDNPKQVTNLSGSSHISVAVVGINRLERMPDSMACHQRATSLLLLMLKTLSPLTETEETTFLSLMPENRYVKS